MSQFSIDIEKYFEELSAMGRQLKGIFCLQYPIFCIHSEISDSTPDPLDNLDKVIVDFIKVKPDFSTFQIGSIIGTSKILIEIRIEKLISDDLLLKKENKYYLTEKGISVFEAKTQLRLHKESYDFFIDGITLKPLPRVFYNYYKSKLVSENSTYLYTNQKGETKIARPFAPDIVHTPPEKNIISDLIFTVEPEQRDEFGIPNGLQSIDDISFTKMSFQVLVSVSKSEGKLIKELIDGYAIYSLGDESTYYDTVKKNVKYFESQVKDRITNLKFKLMMPIQKRDSNEKPTPYLTTNWPEIDRYKDSNTKCYNFSSEDLIKFLQADNPFGFGIKEIETENIINDDDKIMINIRQNHLLKSSNRQKLLSDLIRKRDYKIFNNSLERNVFLFYIFICTDDIIVKDLIEFIELIKEYQRFPFSSFIESHPKYTETIRPFLLLAGEFDLLEKFDIETHMIVVN
ncbi:MAG: hypothetical protein IM469_00180 [Microcystis sp. M176S2]|jgi:hypothetical protein|nr:hypothetical protein [Microcystis sp. M176S2]MCA2720283.1 hypothetical protein [Microcystis sp. M176S2]MCA6492598.1 hypothetical protein [Chitinophagaceae bacterium]